MPGYRRAPGLSVCPPGFLLGARQGFTSHLTGQGRRGRARKTGASRSSPRDGRFAVTAIYSPVYPLPRALNEIPTAGRGCPGRIPPLLSRLPFIRAAPGAAPPRFPPLPSLPFPRGPRRDPDPALRPRLPAITPPPRQQPPGRARASGSRSAAGSPRRQGRPQPPPRLRGSARPYTCPRSGGRRSGCVCGGVSIYPSGVG